MTIVHKAGNSHKNSDGLIIWVLPNTPDNPAYVPTGSEPQIPIEGINNTDVRQDSLKKDLFDIHPTASRFKLLLDKVRHNENQSMNDDFEYAKQKWVKSDKTPEFKVGDLMLVSTLSFNNIKGPTKLKYLFAVSFIIKALHGTNAIQVELSRKLENKQPTFPVSLVKH
ncbi:hypothetical protein O181_111509 [Austropuccinia psidii MF-1]|uniref:Uncharacterized protein n=1 Tax=Austropuccinia psidii MF-1 TaxID=1389203 RepID=A0A9Q3K245_9BASI|nr:hypothetical protein [Austropuccinia psidii MF-1]